MELLNTTRLVAGYTTSTDKVGREWLVVVAKGTYAIPDRPEREPQLLEDQRPLVMTDIFTGEPGSSAPLYENDFAPGKPRCDVLLNGNCHAPHGKPATVVTVAIKAGSLIKAFNVVGPRTYEAGLLSASPATPQPFTTLPISYNNAYGGVDRTHQDPAKHRWYPLNHAGVGFHPKATAAQLHGKPLPNTEELDNPVTKPQGGYRPMAFGPIGRAWQQRIRWAGTYDQKWLDHQFPFLPADFDTRYFQSAPEDQQIDYPHGGEDVALMNLTRQGRTAFRLPADLRLPVLFLSREDRITEVPAVVDTLLLEPDEGRLTLVWRASIPLRRNIHEVSQVKLGTSCRQMMLDRARDERMRGKRRFKSLAEVVEWSKTTRHPNDLDDD
ncbi:DUF2169 domain-containing protein [Pseudomonas chlororaphis]|uniref:DUF2169 family type VI secretion system accessory protein n=1 Tax=Pseudomonas chlororaphis TaxID=587753 RepID=UPI0012326404|nr:DUF2169 domain-containing protein [Pseudomonas chlororaphis]KAA5841503.1 DUF2169 domain-containing protein [Pseudomonas chlororaphis]